MIIGEETTLINVKLNNKRVDELAIVERKLKEFYDRLKTALFPNGTKQTPENLLIEENSPMENPFGSIITEENWRSYYGNKESMSEEDWKTYVSYLIELKKEGRLQYA